MPRPSFRDGRFVPCAIASSAPGPQGVHSVSEHAISQGLPEPFKRPYVGVAGECSLPVGRTGTSGGRSCDGLNCPRVHQETVLSDRASRRAVPPVPGIPDSPATRTPDSPSFLGDAGKEAFDFRLVLPPRVPAATCDTHSNRNEQTAETVLGPPPSAHGNRRRHRIKS